MNRTPHIRFVSVVLAATLAIPLIVPATAFAVPSYTFRGTGYGHGIGMSQYGAQGSALAGKDYRWILAKYYQGTTIGAPSSVPEVKVNIDCAYRGTAYPYPGRPYWTIKSVGSPLQIWRADETSPTVTLAADTWYRFTGDGTNVIVKDLAGVEKVRIPYDVYAVPSGGPALVQVQERSVTGDDGAYHPLDSNGLPVWGIANVRYRGKLWLQRIPSSTRLGAVNRLPMDYYLYGVVPREIPAGWRTDALKAQAVAARSYARASGLGILSCTTYSQVYKGRSRERGDGSEEVFEDSRTNSAVSATTNQFVMYGSAVVRAYFFSQSGGHTASKDDVWGGEPLPYLRGVPDTYEHLASPGRSPWTVANGGQKTFDGTTLRSKLSGLAGVPGSGYVTGIAYDRATSGYVRSATFRFSNGATAKISGDTIRGRLGLYSTNFTTDFPISRISGSTRYDTAVQVSLRSFPATSTAVVLASGENFADALAGSALAGAADGSLLLTSKTALPESVRLEIARLKPETIYVLGGTAVVNDAVMNLVKATVPSAETTRVAGTTRYETAAKVAEVVADIAEPGRVFVVSGTSWADAAAASAYAYYKGYPILLTPSTGLGPEARAFLDAHNPPMTYIGGGTNAVAAGVDAAIASVTGGTVVRLAGYDRYDTARLIAEESLAAGFQATDVYLATSANYADALTGGVLAGVTGKPLLLTSRDACPPNTAVFLRVHKPTILGIYVFGGTGAISATGVKSISNVLTQ